jgi:DNA-binding XRE family transcriptional regulator
MKTRHTDDKTAEVTLTIPIEGVNAVTEMIEELFRFAGHEIRAKNEEFDFEYDKLSSVKKAFPDFGPATILNGARLTFELTQKQLADRLGIKPHHISEMETGKRPISRKMAVKLGKLFDMPPKTFITV